MKAKLDRLLPDIRYWLHHFPCSYTTGCGFGRQVWTTSWERLNCYPWASGRSSTVIPTTPKSNKVFKIELVSFVTSLVSYEWWCTFSSECHYIGPDRQGKARKCRYVGLLIEHIFNTIELGHMIVCRLTASPHNSVHVSDARRRLLRVPRDAVNQCVAAHYPASHRCMLAEMALPSRLRTQPRLLKSTQAPLQTTVSRFESSEDSSSRTSSSCVQSGTPVRS